MLAIIGSMVPESFSRQVYAFLFPLAAYGSLVAALSACPADSLLSGTASSQWDIFAPEVTLGLSETILAITYENEDGDEVANLSVDVTQIPADALFLRDTAFDTAVNVTVRGNEPNPGIGLKEESFSFLEMTEYPETVEPGAQIAGRFQAIIRNEALGVTRNLFGDFEGVISDGSGSGAPSDGESGFVDGTEPSDGE